jgi:hypothetical protein
MTVKISKPAINLREELASLRNQGGLPKEDKLYLDNLVDNGDFSNGTTGWEANSSTLSIDNQRLKVTATAPYGEARYDIPTETGKTYKVTLDYIKGDCNGYVEVRNQGFNVNLFTDANNVYTANTTREFTFVAIDPVSKLRLLNSHGTSSGNYNFWDNVSVQEVGENLVTNGTFDTDSGWAPSAEGSASGISNGQAYLESSGGNARLTQNVNLEAGKTYTIQFDLISQASFGLSYVRLGTLELLPVNSVSIGTNSGTFVANSASNLYFGTYANSGSSFTIDNVILTEGSHQVIQSIPYGYDVKDVYIDGELAREGEAYDYEVKTDGINQWLKPTVEPTATTETVVIGVRK